MTRRFFAPIARFLVLSLALAALPASGQTAAEAPPIALSSAVASAPAPAPAPPSSKDSPALARARALYFSADVLTAAHAFEQALKRSTDADAWLDGSIAWGEAGRPDKAVEYARKAAALKADARSRTMLGWALLRDDEPKEADAAFAAALKADAEDPWAVLGAGRAKLALGRPAEAVPLLKKADDFTLQQTLADFFLGRAEEALGDETASMEAYKRSVIGDSYFHESRGMLTRAYLRLKRYDDAWRQLKRLAEAEPSARLTRALMDKVRPLLARPAEPAPAAPSAPPPLASPGADSETQGGIPFIRVGIATTALGHPRARLSVTVRGSAPWHAYDPKTGRTLAECGAQEAWTVRRVPPKGRKGRARLELRGPDGQVRAVPGDLVRLEPKDPVRGVLALEDDPEKGGPLGTGRSMRGALEVALYHSRRTLRLVNIVNLEDYTEGVVGAEMPANSPLEALKAQALIARTHALFIKTISHRHRKQGYDVCDGQHCQVYAGVRMETERTRAAVAATRGRVAVYKGKLAHVIYSSNCGGSSQSGDDIGWGHIPYWTRESDSATPVAPPASPLELRRYLSTWPDTFDRPSGFVHPSISRWSRVVSVKELEERVNRHHRIGRLKGLRVLRRAPTGNVEALLLLGSRRDLKLRDEFSIRGVLGAGSLRSTLFVVDTEYRRRTERTTRTVKGKKTTKTRTVLEPSEFVFRGGGWGHAVGLCQSGAIGRAEAGQDYETIVKAYFRGTQLSTLDYTTMHP